MIVLYDKLEDAYYDVMEQAGSVGGIFLEDAITCEVTEDYNKIPELEMSYPVSGNAANQIKENKILYVETDKIKYAFIIREIEENVRDVKTVHAIHVAGIFASHFPYIEEGMYHSTIGDAIELYNEEWNKMMESGMVLDPCVWIYCEDQIWPLHINGEEDWEGWSQTFGTILFSEGGALTENELNLWPQPDEERIKLLWHFEEFTAQLQYNWMGMYGDEFEIREGKNESGLTIETNEGNVPQWISVFIEPIPELGFEGGYQGIVTNPLVEQRDEEDIPSFESMNYVAAEVHFTAWEWLNYEFAIAKVRAAGYAPETKITVKFVDENKSKFREWERRDSSSYTMRI